MKNLIKAALLCGAIALVGAQSANGQLNIAVDEFGNGIANGNPLFSTLGPDPTGGLTNWNVLIYSLPFAGVPGDVLMAETNGPIFDVLRFDGAGHLIFYSDNIDGFDAPADTPGPPSPLLPNQVTIPELGVDEVNAYGLYSPLPGQPGFDPSFPNYTFVSDGQVPEPGSAALLVTGLGIFGVWRRRRQVSQ